MAEQVHPEHAEQGEPADDVELGQAIPPAYRRTFLRGHGVSPVIRRE